MARFELKAGASIDLLTKPELDESLRGWDPFSKLRATTAMRLPLVTGKAAGSALSMGGDSGQVVQGPDQGYVWSIRHLVIEGMATGATPDVINILRGQRIVWQLNGNQFAQTWGRGEIVYQPGETIGYVSVGMFNSTSTIIAHGLAEQVPAELVGRFYG